MHAAWRTDVPTAIDVVRRSLDGTRTPGPLREARRLARVARSGTERELPYLLDRPAGGGRPVP